MFRLELSLASPWMNAAGMLGFAPQTAPGSRRPPGQAETSAVEPMGAFVTNPISLNPRAPAADRCMVPFAGGVLLHSGLPNPGLSRVLRRYAARWAKSPAPVWVHLIGSNPDEIYQMVRRLEGIDGVEAVEIGLPPNARDDQALAFIDAAYGELPLIAHLPLTAAAEPWLDELPAHGASAVSFGGPRGTLLDETGRPVSGRLYGPALLPLIMAAVQTARRLGIPIIAGAGIYHPRDAQMLRDAGAWAVQLDTVLWRGWER